MQSALVFVEDDGGNHQADESSADNSGTQACSVAAYPLNLQAEDTVAHAVTQGSHEQHLFQREEAQGRETVVLEEGCRNEAAQGPVQSQGTQPAPGAGD